MENKENKSISRRKFIGTTAAATAGFTILPSYVISGFGYKMPSDKLNIAGVGIGGVGAHNVTNCAGENIIALCDVDWDYAGATFEKYPDAKKFKDYGKCLTNWVNL